MRGQRRLLVMTIVCTVVGLFVASASHAAAPSFARPGETVVFEGGRERVRENRAPDLDRTGSTLALPSATVPANPSTFDPFPRTIGDMNGYERVAMSPYPDYDTLPLQERARLYRQQFKLLYDREPVFSPRDQAEIDWTSSTVKSREELYKAPAKAQSAAPVNLDSVPGPWASGAIARPAAPAKAPAKVARREPLMENLRGSWNLRNAIKGGQ